MKLHHIKWRPNPAGITTWFHEFYQYTIKYVALENTLTVMFLFTKLSNTFAQVTRWTTPGARKFYIQRTMRLNAASLHTYDKSPWLWCHSESSTAHVAWSVDLVTICHFSCVVVAVRLANNVKFGCSSLSKILPLQMDAAACCKGMVWILVSHKMPRPFFDW